MNCTISLNLRPPTAADTEFLCELYASTRFEEVAAWGWNAEQQAAFLRMQFQAQEASYRIQFPDSDRQLVLWGDRAIGCIWVAHTPDAVCLISIALLPGYRNQGIGTDLIQRVFAKATASCRSVRLHVLKFNPAIRFYERLGFVPVEDTGTHYLMVWSPPASAIHPTN
jgi:ribosomal protein S18 acetylase RimI-like enzyme